MNFIIRIVRVHQFDLEMEASGPVEIIRKITALALECDPADGNITQIVSIRHGEEETTPSAFRDIHP
jgi:hypothetical protein